MTKRKQLCVSFVTLFPDSLTSTLHSSIMGRAVRQGVLRVAVEPIRQHGLGKHRRVDDTPYGGGPGQLLRVDVVVSALRAALARSERAGSRSVVLVDAAGAPFTHHTAKRWAQLDHVVFVCGRYEGIDSRIHHYVDETASIGDYVLTGGELPALVMLDATLRHVPGVLGNPLSSSHDSFEDGLLEHSQYTVPVEFEGHRVPRLPRGGHHARIAQARHAERVLRTQLMRPPRGFGGEAPPPPKPSIESEHSERQKDEKSKGVPEKYLRETQNFLGQKGEQPPWLRHAPK
ncbi:MAG: tRNA (guanosine(37)-N1)-methyltransferase TrmD [Myxococcota bacterium]